MHPMSPNSAENGEPILDKSLWPSGGFDGQHLDRIYRTRNCAPVESVIPRLSSCVPISGISVGPAPNSIPRESRLHLPFTAPSPRTIRRGLLLGTCEHTPAAPIDGSSPMSTLPDELWIQIISHLPQAEVLNTRAVSRRYARLALSPALHRTITLFGLPKLPINNILAKHIFPSVHHLNLHLSPYPSTTTHEPHPSTVLRALLDCIPVDQLRSLVFPFSAPYLNETDLGTALKRLGGKLEKLDLRGSGVEGFKYLDWMQDVGIKGKGLRELDLAFTAISALPQAPLRDGPSYSVAPHPWTSLKHLSLGSCSSLSTDVLVTFLANLPSAIETLDLSRLDQISYQALRDLSVTVVTEEKTVPSALREIKIIGIDHLTRSSIRAFKRHWDNQREVAMPVITSEPKVWGEPCTPPYHDTQRTRGYDHFIQTTSTPGLSSRCSSADSYSGSSASNRSYEINNSYSHVNLVRTVEPGPSVLSAHSALWDALSSDKADGMFATPDVWSSKLGANPYLPSRSAPRPHQQQPVCSSPNTVRRNAIVAFPTLHPLSPSSLGTSSAILPTIQRKKNTSINIIHSAILESEDDEGYRLFVEQVAGAVQPPHNVHLMGLGSGSGMGLGLGLGLGPDASSGVETGVGGAPGMGHGLGQGAGNWTWEAQSAWQAGGMDFEYFGQVGHHGSAGVGADEDTDLEGMQ